MEKPFWFNVIEQWKEMGKGEYGVTFPFLIGAIIKTTGKVASKELVQSVLQEIIENPVAGFYCEVRWCGNINEPVASVKNSSEIHKVSIKSQFNSKNTGSVSLAFTTDLMSMFTLNCSTNKECLERIIALTVENTEKGEFSKNGGVFTPFTEGDLNFIEVVNAL